MADEYEVLEELGSGSFGVVYRGIEKSTGDLVAIKHIDLDSSEDDIQDIQQEITVLSTCSSPFVTQYKASFLRGHKLWIVMEYLGGGSCLDLLRPGPFEEQHISIICRELLLGLDYLHTEGKIHRDIKAANILLARSGKVKLADFGVAAQLTNFKSQRNTFVGTPFWMAPEVIQQSGYDFKADIWSLGITAIELVQCEPPHASIHPMKALFLIPKSTAPRLEGKQYSNAFKDFLSVCLIKDPDRRPTAKELLNHRFIKDAGAIERLQQLLYRRQQWNQGEDQHTRPRFYEETMKDIKDDRTQNSWVFDTVKPSNSSGTAFRRDKGRQLGEICTTQNAAFIPVTVWAPSAEEGQDLSRELKRGDSIKMSESCVSRIGTDDIDAEHAGKELRHRQPLEESETFGNRMKYRPCFKNEKGTRASFSDQCGTSEENCPRNTRMEENGKFAISKAINPAFQDILAGTSGEGRRSLISKLAQSWDLLGNVDAEGSLLLLSNIIGRVQSDPVLSSLLLKCPTDLSSKPKLVLASSNPHLRSHRRRNSSIRKPSTAKTDHQHRLNGSSSQGLDHFRQLTDALYSKWLDAMVIRWPNTI